MPHVTINREELATLARKPEALDAAMTTAWETLLNAVGNGLTAMRPYMGTNLALTAAKGINDLSNVSDDEREYLLAELIDADPEALAAKYDSGVDYVSHHAPLSLKEYRRKANPRDPQHNPCHRCGGLGFIARFSSSHGGVCYNCNGSGCEQ